MTHTNDEKLAYLRRHPSVVAIRDKYLFLLDFKGPIDEEIAEDRGLTIVVMKIYHEMYPGQLAAMPEEEFRVWILAAKLRGEI